MPLLRSIRTVLVVFLSTSTLSLLLAQEVYAAKDPRSLPRLSIAQLNAAFEGAFKVEYRSPRDIAGTTNDLNTAYANGRIAYSHDEQSVFIDSHVYSDAIGEFRIPGVLSRSSDPEQLPNAAVKQDFQTVFDRVTGPNDEGTDSLGGMAVVGNELFVQVYDYYDAPGQDQHTTLVFDNKSNLAAATVKGFYDLNGAAKTVSYLSPIPKGWQAILGGDFLAGNGGGIPINSRASMGPSLFAFQSKEFVKSSGGPIQSKEWLSYDLDKPLSKTPGVWDQYNQLGLDTNFEQSNRLWTQASAAWFGFIPAGTRTFVVLGESGMHNSGGGYKITQTNGNLCGGPCPYDPLDSSPYYWLYDLKDVLSASPDDTLLPYDYGEFNSRYLKKGTNGVSGGAYDPESGKLMLLLKSATRESNDGSPIVTVYQLAAESLQAVISPIVDLLMGDTPAEL